MFSIRDPLATPLTRPGPGRWASLGRAARYRNRCGADGEGGSGGVFPDPDNPLPGFIDPITLEPVANPAISPLGHVMGLATWKVLHWLGHAQHPVGSCMFGALVPLCQAHCCMPGDDMGCA